MATEIPLSEAAVILKESPSTVYQRLVRGELKGEKRRGRWMIDTASFEQWLGQHATHAAPAA